jgi:uncharacterized membrane protein (UPF0127 family)
LPHLAACAALIAACASTPAPDLFPELERAQLAVVTATGTHYLTVWIADDEQSRARGLMFVRELPADHGMLFVFKQPQFASFWMKNTPLSLDIVFVAAEGNVVNVASGTRPHALEPVRSTAPALYVLELVAGTAARIGLEAGDRVVYRTSGLQKSH